MSERRKLLPLSFDSETDDQPIQAEPKPPPSSTLPKHKPPRERLHPYEDASPEVQAEKHSLIQDLCAYAGGPAKLHTLMPLRYIPSAYRRPSDLKQYNVVVLHDPKDWRPSFLKSLKRVVEASARDPEFFIGLMDSEVTERWGARRGQRHVPRHGPRELTTWDLDAVADWLEGQDE